MAEQRNRNRSGSGSGGNRDFPGNRYNQEDFYNEDQGYYDNVNYNREKDFDRYRQYGQGMSAGYGRSLQDENRQNQYENTRYGSTGSNMGNRDWRGESSDYGNYQGSQQYNKGYGDQYGSSGGYENRNFNSGRNWRDDEPYYTNMANRDYGTGTGYRGAGNTDSGRDRYSDEGSQYRSSGRRDDDRGWWDKTRDKVSSWFGDEDAERRTRMDNESGPHRGKGPKGYKRSDERIREDVCDRLCDHPMIDASGIDIKVEGSEVVLTGTVDSKEDKRRAEDIAESVSGVNNVQNQIRVEHKERGSTHERSRTRSGNAW